MQMRSIKQLRGANMPFSQTKIIREGFQDAHPASSHPSVCWAGQAVRRGGGGGFLSQSPASAGLRGLSVRFAGLFVDIRGPSVSSQHSTYTI